MIFKNFESTDIVAGRINKVSSGFWVDGNYAVTQSTFTTSSTQVVLTGSNQYDVQNGLYYYNVYYQNQPHFSITYGDYYGSGSSVTDATSLYIRPTQAIYNQYKNVLLTPDDTFFNFKTGNYTVATSADSTTSVTGSGIVVLNFSADKYKDRVDEGQIEFSISGANGQFTFIDDSSVVKKQLDVYNIISGSVNDGVPSAYSNGGVITYNSIGLFYPKTGTVVLNAGAISSSVGVSLTGSFATVADQTNTYALNQRTMFQAITKCTTKTFKVRKSEYLPSAQYFVRVKNQDYNYTNNPTFIANGTTDSLNGVVLARGSIKINDFVNNPTTYITTVGLYDSDNELVAVAKLSQPTQKTFDSELLIRVRLDF
jgi:hypothetical protein